MITARSAVYPINKIVNYTCPVYNLKYKIRRNIKYTINEIRNNWQLFNRGKVRTLSGSFTHAS